jgi:RNA polymerase sigma factor (sigma-70 family)
MNDHTDSQLLRTYAEHRDEAAFAELVRRHVDLVHSAAFRMVRDPQLAQDVTQGAFVALAKTAGQLTECRALSGWLHRTAQNIASQVVRTDVRRRAREQEAVIMNQLLSAEPDAPWERIAPHLDAALGELDGPERDALLLRYFENKSLRAVGQQLGISDDAAQKRVSRAVERLRKCFANRGVTIGAGALVVVISANAVQAAPVGLSVTISAAALAGTAVSTATVVATTTKAVAMTALQKSLVTATVAVLAGAGIYEAHQASQLREQNQTFQQQQVLLEEQIQQMQRERDDATNRLADLIAENSRLKASPQEMEVLRLRGEVARLRADSRELALLKGAVSVSTNNPTETAIRNWVSRVQEVHQRIEQMPGVQIPEFKFLTPTDWLDVAKDASVETDQEVKNAANILAGSAKSRFAALVRDALRKYLKVSNGELPTTMSQLKPFFPIRVDDDVLQRYAIIQSGNIRGLTETDRKFRLVSERTSAAGRAMPIVQIGVAGFIRTAQ